MPSSVASRRDDSWTLRENWRTSGGARVSVQPEDFIRPPKKKGETHVARVPDRDSVHVIPPPDAPAVPSPTRLGNAHANVRDAKLRLVFVRFACVCQRERAVGRAREENG